MNFQEKFDLFFKEPDKFVPGPHLNGTLHLLRRDLIQCCGENPDNGKVLIEFKNLSLWPATMMIHVGIDLLGKCYNGKDERNEVGKRYVEYVEKYFTGLMSGDATRLYEYRNALLHSFGDSHYDRKVQTPASVFKAVPERKSQLIEYDQKKAIYLISFPILRDSFELSVQSYMQDVQNNTGTIRQDFERMFDKYGSMQF